jgi:hypothetical protein
MSSATIAGAVNGMAVTRDVVTSGSSLVTIPFSDNGNPTVFDVNTDGTAPDSPTSSRVAFIAGSTSGRDHFPQPAIDGGFLGTDVYPDEYYPLGLSLTQAMKWTWLVKQWSMTGTVTFDATNLLDSSVTNFTATYDVVLNPYDNVFSFNISTESSLVNLFGIVVQSGTADVDPANAGFFENGLGMLDSSYPSFVFHDDLLHPEIDYSAQIDGQLADPMSDTFFSLIISTRKTVGTGDFAAGGIVIDGHALPVYYDLSNTNNCTLSNVQFEPIIVAPSEYWPYATKAGDPVYDTSTGAQIADPLS